MKEDKSIVTFFGGLALGIAVGSIVTAQANKGLFRKFNDELRRTRKRIGRSIKSKFKKEKEEIRRLGKLPSIDPTL